ncbi:hypothetical protein BH23BAC3_BH23BAC3_24000 [soil metagenome]
MNFNGNIRKQRAPLWACLLWSFSHITVDLWSLRPIWVLTESIVPGLLANVQLFKNYTVENKL